MSVFTSVDQDQLDDFLLSYDLGKAISLKGIANGITNSNYKLETDTGPYILTLFEVTGPAELDFALELQQFLRRSGVSVAAPVLDKQGRRFSSLNDRSAAIIEFLNGDYWLEPDLGQIRVVAKELARFHRVTLNYAKSCPNIRGIPWCFETSEKLAPELNKADQSLLKNSIGKYLELSKLDLPRCAIHADLFRDNVLFVDGQLSGFIDFDYACVDLAILDIAVTVNDWCLDDNRQIDSTRINTFIEAYQTIRNLSEMEKQSIVGAMRFAATRFWLSRLYDWHFPMSGSLTFRKNPDDFKHLLVALQDYSLRLS